MTTWMVGQVTAIALERCPRSAWDEPLPVIHAARQRRVDNLMPQGVDDVDRAPCSHVHGGGLQPSAPAHPSQVSHSRSQRLHSSCERFVELVRIIYTFFLQCVIRNGGLRCKAKPAGSRCSGTTVLSTGRMSSFRCGLHRLIADLHVRSVLASRAACAGPAVGNPANAPGAHAGRGERPCGPQAACDHGGLP